MTIPDLLDQSYYTSNISEAKLGLVYLSENVFRAALPAFDQMTEQYEKVCVCIHACIHTHVNAYTYMHTHTCTYRYMHMYMYMYMYIYIHIYTYI